ncbi:hypothetical protein E6D34_10595 [Escherichia coli]|uniref:Uncharacterized protein n=1 Tax=Escherichia coli TaxID=562 RepID=A0A8S7K0P0_ECOLX|nr:hypothetical protein [Escherichia coli]EFC9749713.1 hypothetical protein [Escherichia coli]EFN7269755.1 hypothetical protein [Escherichia coli O21]
MPAWSNQPIQNSKADNLLITRSNACDFCTLPVNGYDVRFVCTFFAHVRFAESMFLYFSDS